MKPRLYTSGFSLVEVLVAVAILGLLVGVSGAAYQKVMGKASLAAEVSAAKNLTQAYLLAAAENGGRYLVAKDETVGNQVILNGQGKPISMTHVKHRYPFRLAPYFNYQMEGTILVNQNEAQIMRELKSGSSGAMYDYGLSQFPALGINRHLVGGVLVQEQNSAKLNRADECIQTIGQAEKSIIVFISAGNSRIDGYEYVTPPHGPGGQWSTAKWGNDSDPGNYGYVHPRFEGKAVAAFLDGSVRVLSLDELRDMRLWSRNAALADDPNYRIK